MAAASVTARTLLVLDTAADPDCKLQAAALPERTTVVTFSSDGDALADVVAKIKAAGTGFGAVGLANHGSAQWRLARDVTVNLEGADWLPALQPLAEALLGACAATGRVDLMGCDLLRFNPALVAELERQYPGANFAASYNETGNAVDGHDWIMESDQVDIADDYFCADRVAEYHDALIHLKGIGWKKARTVYRVKKKTGVDKAINDACGVAVKAAVNVPLNMLTEIFSEIKHVAQDPLHRVPVVGRIADAIENKSQNEQLKNKISRCLTTGKVLCIDLVIY